MTDTIQIPSNTHIELMAIFTLIKRGIHRFFRLWRSTILPPLLTTFLFSVIFGKILGPRIGQTSEVSYIQFIIPGLLMNVVINEAFQNVAFQVFQDKFVGVLDTIICSPLSKHGLLIALLLSSVIRNTILTIFLLLFFYFFAGVHIIHLGSFILIFILSSTILSLIGFFNGLLSTNFDQLGTIPSFVLTPLGFFSGVFYNLYRFDGFWFYLSQWNPLVHILSIFRYAMLDLEQGLEYYHTKIFLLTLLCMILYASVYKLYANNWRTKI